MKKNASHKNPARPRRESADSGAPRQWKRKPRPLEWARENLREFNQLLDSVPQPPADSDAAGPTAPDEQPLATAREIESQTPPETPPDSELIWFTRRSARDVEWLWEGRVPLGKCTLLVGDPDAGKSFLTLDLAARVTRGIGVPPEEGLQRPASVLLLSADDHVDDTILPRLQAAGADLSRIALFPRKIRREGDAELRLPSLAMDIHRIEQALVEMGDCRLVIVDPISAYLRGVDTYNNFTVRQHLLKLSELAEQFGAAFLLVSHQRKASAPTAMYRAIGSMAFTAVARVVLLVTADQSLAGRRLLLPVKMTLQTATTGRAFSIEDGRVGWEEQLVPFTADEMSMLMRTGEDSVDAVREAVLWLKELLMDSKRMPADEIQQLAREKAIPKGVLWTAKKQACIKAVRDGKAARWYWERIVPWYHGMVPDEDEWEIAMCRAKS